MKNYSRQREEIIKVVKDSCDHPTAEDIYMIVKANDPSVSRSTVYRNLGMLVERNMINKIPMQSGGDRYDYPKQQHNHAICIKCGKVFDFLYDLDNEKMKKTIKEQTGVEISDARILVQGICNSCKNI